MSEQPPPFYALGIVAYSLERTIQHAQVALDQINKILEEYNVEARRKD